MNMKRVFAGLGLLAHGLAHALPGAQAGAAGTSWLLSGDGMGPGAVRWLVAFLSALAMSGFVAAGFGVWGARPFRSHWRSTAAVAAIASLLLLFMFWTNAYGIVGIVIDLAIMAWLWVPSPDEEPEREAPLVRSKRLALRATSEALAVAFVAWLGLVAVTAPAHRFWGSKPDELDVVLPGDAPLEGPPTYWIQHAVTIHAPAEAVWPWLAQLGTDRGGFYSYDFLERALRIDAHNADRVHPEWQDVHAGGFVMATPKGYLGIDHPLGWKLTEVEPGRVMVLQNWGAFVLDPIDAHTTRFIVRTRNSVGPSPMGLAMSWFGLVTFEPVHFLMERRMLLGVKERAEAPLR
jgi:hypothetical protein